MTEQEIKTHLSHCYQDEYSDSCKYGDRENCPAQPVDLEKIKVIKIFKDAIEEINTVGCDAEYSPDCTVCNALEYLNCFIETRNTSDIKALLKEVKISRAIDCARLMKEWLSSVNLDPPIDFASELQQGSDLHHLTELCKQFIENIE